jgi:hypothetical protein
LTDALTLPFADEAIAVNRIADLYRGAGLAARRAPRCAAPLRRTADRDQPAVHAYVDLRAARWAEIEPYTETGDASEVATVVPEGAAGLLAIAEDRVVAAALSPAAESAGVVLDTLRQRAGPPP